MNTDVRTSGGNRFNDRDHNEIYRKFSSRAHECGKNGRELGFTKELMIIIESTTRNAF